MRLFDYSGVEAILWDKKVLNLIAQIYESKGRQEYLIKKSPKKFDGLIDLASRQSIEFSNKIEGVIVDQVRICEIQAKDCKPQNNAEREAFGYADVLNDINSNFNNIEVSVKKLLELHSDLYKFTDGIVRGRFKSIDNAIKEIDESGNEKIRFVPLSAYLTPPAVESLCQEFNKTLNKSSLCGIILVPIFVLDFLCIHPFIDGNGRLSRLLTQLALLKCGFCIGRFISIDKIIAQTRERYYSALMASSTGWHQKKNDYEPFVRYFLNTILTACSALDKKLNLT